MTSFPSHVYLKVCSYFNCFDVKQLQLPQLSVVHLIIFVSSQNVSKRLWGISFRADIFFMYFYYRDRKTDFSVFKRELFTSTTLKATSCYFLVDVESVRRSGRERDSPIKNVNAEFFSRRFCFTTSIHHKTINQSAIMLIRLQHKKRR